jgi:glutamate-ammonia-ligase adenylyltransferase
MVPAAAGRTGARHMEQALAALQERGQPLPAALRILRQLVMERLIVLDC